MSDLPADANHDGGVDFKINPTLIDSTTITNLETFPHASGGLGGVWKCSMSTPSGTRTIVAVKCMRVPKGSDEELIQKIRWRIRREAYVWITLLHDHILPFLGITMSDDFGSLPALVSPWMDNRSLNDYLQREFPQLSDHRKLELIRQVAAGLCYLHEEKSIAHGNLTGTDVLVDDSGKLCIADFGLSMFLPEADDATFNSMHPGNARWMAPEFVLLPVDLEDSEEDSEIQLPQKPTKAGDVYSFGCVMLQILSGKEPYARIRNIEHVVSAIVLGRAPFNADRIDMNGSHRQLSSQCLSREPKGRPSIVEITTIMGHPATRQPNATRHRGDWRRNPYPGPSNDSPHHHLSTKQSTTTPPARQQYGSAHLSSHQHALPGRTSPSRRNNYNTEDIPTQPRFLQLARNLFFNTRNSRIGEGSELQERRTEVVDVPFAQAVPRQDTARKGQRDRKQAREEEKRKAREAREAEKQKAREAREAEKQKARETKNAKNTKNAPASSSQPSESNVYYQPGEGAQTQPTPSLHLRDEDRESDEDVDLLVNDTLLPSWGPIGSVRGIGGEDIEDRSSRSATILTSENQPILTPINPKYTSSHSHHAQLSVSMYPAQDLGPAVDDSDGSTSILRPLMDYIEGHNFDLRGISASLSSPSPDVQCAALQLLEHAAEWESINFAECMSVTFGPVVELLDSQDSEVRYAALDTLKLFLASPRATDVVKSMIPRLVDAVLDNLTSPDPLVQLASVELLDAAMRSEEILVEFAGVVSRISRVLPTMPTATQVTALRVLEVSTGSNTPELVKAVAGTFQCLSQLLSSPETTVQIAALKVLEAGTRTKDPELARAVKNILPELTNIQSSGGTDIRNATEKLLEWGAHHDRLPLADLTYTMRT